MTVFGVADELQMEYEVELEGAVRLNEAVFEPPFSPAVTTAVAFAVTVPAVAVKVAEVADAATFAEAGTVSIELLSETATDAPPEGAGPESFTVQVLLAPDAKVVGVQVSDETVTAAAAVRLNEAVFEPPFKAAVTTAVVLAVTVPAVAVKVAEVVEAATLTEAGTVSIELLSESATAAPPEGAAPESVTVQVLVPADANVAGVQVSDETVTVADGVPAWNTTSTQ